MANRYVPQTTLQYTTFIKRGLVEALTQAFKDHPDPTVSQTHVALDFRHDRFRLPAIIIRYVERDIPNAGVGHVEYLPFAADPHPENPTEFVKYYHRMYHGEILWEIYAMSSADRDVVRDALVEVLTMQELTSGGFAFIERLYWALENTPYGTWHFPVLNLDMLSGTGDESPTIAPWRPEDQLVYKATYNVPIFGEFYSHPPTPIVPAGLVTEIDVYPYISQEDGHTPIDPTPEENPDPGTPINPWYHFTGWKSTDKII